MPEKNRTLTVHHAVHGYRGGHRLMTASISLEADTEAILLTMSDALTSEPLGSVKSYLTGYPIKSAHKFVLARTWAAPESPRRGSVWTHSLLLDYSTLTQLEDLFVLLQLFRRPSLDSLSSFDKPTLLQPGRTISSLIFSDMLSSDDRARNVLTMIYGATARNRIKTHSKGNAQDEILALGVWRQMWPSLRRSFSFSTVVSAEELGVGDFGLNFERDELTHEPSVSFSPKDQAGLDSLTKDLPKRGPTRLRRFLGRYAYDAKNPRLIAPPLAAIFSGRKDSQDALASYETLLRGTPGLLRLKNDLLMASATDRSNPTALSKSLNMFAHEPASPSITSLITAIREAPFIANGEAILHAVSESPPGSIGEQIFPVLTEVLPIEMLATEVPAHAKERLLHLRRDVVRQNAFWLTSEAMREHILNEAISLNIATDDLLAGLGNSLTTSTARQIISNDRLSALSIYEKAASSINKDILDLLSTYPDFISRLSNSEISVPIELIEYFATKIVKTEPTLWCEPEDTTKLIARSRARLTHAQPYLATIALSTAALSRDQKSYSLFECAFDPALDSSDRFAMPSDCQQLLLKSPAMFSTRWIPERLFAIALDKYSKRAKIDVRIFCISANPNAITRLAKHIARYFGEDELRRIFLELDRLRDLQVPRSVVVQALESAMPFFSKPLKKK